MLEITAAEELLPLVGTPAFLPATLAYVRGLASATPPLEPSIFQAIFHCIIAGDKNLIIHTPEEDVGLVARLALWTLSSLFDIPTHRLKIKARPDSTSRHVEHGPPPTPEVLLRSLFMRSSTRGDVSESSRPPSRARNGKVKQTEYRRSASYPKELPSRRSSPHLATLATLADQEPLAPASRPHPLGHANTEPEMRPRTAAPLELPTAIVATGLEHSSVAQQKALERVFAERQITLNGSGIASVTLQHERHEDGVWPLPEGFIMIYVCPWDPRERPSIYKALLDRFSMSTNVIVAQNVRHAFKSLPMMSNTSVPRARLHSFSRTSNPSTPSPLTPTPLPKPTYSPIMSSKSLPLHQPRPQYHAQTSQQSYYPTRPSPHPLPQASPAPVLPKQLFPRSFLVILQQMARQAYFSPELRLYLLDLFAATRHHSQLDGMLLTMRATDDAEALAKAARVIGNDPTGAELLDQALGSSLYEWDGVNNADTEDALSIGQSASDTLARPSSRKREGESIAEASSTGSSVNDPRRLLYVTEADIARTMPRVVTHRLRVRDGPEDEVLASAVFGATFGRKWEADGVEGGDGQEERPTIKDILVSILSEV